MRHFPFRLRARAMFCALAVLAAGHPGGIACAGGIPLGTAFTYQGQLKQAGTPADGLFDFEFRLFRVPAGGTALGTVIETDLAVTEGLFTVNLDFGGGHYNGDALWLEITVEGTALTPRQPLNPTPYALHAASATVSGEQAEDVDFTNAGNSFTGSGAGLTSLNASNLSSGTLGSARLSGSYTNALTLNNASNSFTGSFNGSGAALTNLNASNISAGNLAAARLPTGGAWPLSSNLNIAGLMTFEPITSGVGIGTTFPLWPLEVVNTPPSNNIQPVAVFRQAGATNSVGAIRLQNTANNHFNLGITAISNDFALGYNSNIGQLSDLLRITPSGNVGIRTVNPLAQLHVAGNGDTHVRIENTAGGGATYNMGITGIDNSFRINHTGGARMTILPSGDVGIGTVAPVAKLHVNGSGRVEADLDVGGGAFFVNNTFDRVGIGTALPITTLHTVGHTRLDGDLFVDLSTFSVNSATNSIGIGTLTPSANLHVVGTTTLDGATNFTSVPTLPTTTRRLHINPAEFVPRFNTTGVEHDQAQVWGTTAGQGVEFFAPLTLPDGAVVTNVTFVVRDNDAVQNITCRLQRDTTAIGTGSASVVTVGSGTSAGPSTNFAGVSISGLPHTVDYAGGTDQSYVLHAFWTVPATPNNLRLLRVEVTYTVTAPLP